MRSEVCVVQTHLTYLLEPTIQATGSVYHRRPAAFRTEPGGLCASHIDCPSYVRRTVWHDDASAEASWISFHPGVQRAQLKPKGMNVWACRGAARSLQATEATGARGGGGLCVGATCPSLLDRAVFPFHSPSVAGLESITVRCPFFSNPTLWWFA